MITSSSSTECATTEAAAGVVVKEAFCLRFSYFTLTHTKLKRTHKETYIVHSSIRFMFATAAGKLDQIKDDKIYIKQINI